MTTDKQNGSNEKFAHAMRREIYEQPVAIARTIEKHLKNDVIFPGELHAIESALLTFEKLIIAHGVCIEKDAKPFVERAFRWLVRSPR